MIFRVVAMVIKRGTNPGRAQVKREELELHRTYLEVLACSECGKPLAFCRAHQDTVICDECGVSF